MGAEEGTRTKPTPLERSPENNPCVLSGAECAAGGSREWLRARLEGAGHGPVVEHGAQQLPLNHRRKRKDLGPVLLPEIRVQVVPLRPPCCRHGPVRRGVRHSACLVGASGGVVWEEDQVGRREGGKGGKGYLGAEILDDVIGSSKHLVLLRHENGRVC